MVNITPAKQQHVVTVSMLAHDMGGEPNGPTGAQGPKASEGPYKPEPLCDVTINVAFLVSQSNG